MAWGYHIDYAACSGHILHGWPCVHLYPWLKRMCPAAAISCIIHDVSEFSTSVVSVCQHCVSPVPPHPFPLNGNDKPPNANTHTHTGTNRKHINTHTCTITHKRKQNVQKILHHTTPKYNNPKWGGWLTIRKLLASSVCVCVSALPWRAPVRCLMTGRQSAAAAAEVVESLGRPLKAHRVLGVGSPDLVKAFPCSSTQLCFSSSCSSDSTSLIPHPNAAKTH